MIQKVLDAGFLGLNTLHNELEPIDNNLFYQRRKIVVLIFSGKKDMLFNRLAEMNVSGQS